jgi:hypothetical protein
LNTLKRQMKKVMEMKMNKCIYFNIDFRNYNFFSELFSAYNAF